ncbi:MAG TPA: histidinol-phosphate transaminase [Methylomirabilota bacterium]|nr:histidinol-phosphate transaminase [Methylomirabilota bacterium]
MKRTPAPKRNPRRLIRAGVRKLRAYVPGEQPKVRGLIKLNTNENPYPPSPAVIEAVRQATDQRLRLYPNPAADPLREALAALHGCRTDNVIAGNGSDELLALATRAFVEPISTGDKALQSSRPCVQYFTPSYSLYPVLADIHGSRRNPVPLGPDFALPSVSGLKAGRKWDFGAALTFITTPNAPSGRGYDTAELEALCRVQRGVVILDEAYVDFATENAMELALKFPHVIVSRTFSKSCSLCFQRVGYFVGHPELIGALHRIRDSYNVNGLGQVAALATLGDIEYYRKNIRRIISTRTRLAGALGAEGFKVLPSEANFLLVRPPRLPARDWLEALRERRILVRWFDQPKIRQYLRITIGSDAEVDALLRAVRGINRRAGLG